MTYSKNEDSKKFVHNAKIEEPLSHYQSLYYYHHDGKKYEKTTGTSRKLNCSFNPIKNMITSDLNNLNSLKLPVTNVQVIQCYTSNNDTDEGNQLDEKGRGQDEIELQHNK